MGQKLQILFGYQISRIKIIKKSKYICFIYFLNLTTNEINNLQLLINNVYTGTLIICNYNYIQFKVTRHLCSKRDPLQVSLNN